jgi:hypothetical protein
VTAKPVTQLPAVAPRVRSRVTRPPMRQFSGFRIVTASQCQNSSRPLPACCTLNLMSSTNSGFGGASPVANAIASRSPHVDEWFQRLREITRSPAACLKHAYGDSFTKAAQLTGVEHIYDFLRRGTPALLRELDGWVNNETYRQLQMSLPRPTWADSSLPLPPSDTRRCAVITAIVGQYERQLKPVAARDDGTRCDLIAFIDSASAPNVTVESSGGWSIDTVPYHRPAVCVTDAECLAKRFLVGKFYKMRFATIPRLRQYRVVIWLDATIEIVSPDYLPSIVNLTTTHQDGVASLGYPMRPSLLSEAVVSSTLALHSPYGIGKGYDRAMAFYVSYLVRGYCEEFLLPNAALSAAERNASRVDAVAEELRQGYLAAEESMMPSLVDPIFVPTVRRHYRLIGNELANTLIKLTRTSGTCHRMRRRAGSPVHLTAIVAVDMTNPAARLLSDLWWHETLLGNLQDQMTFSFATQTLAVDVARIDGMPGYVGNATHSNMHIKHAHDGIVLDRHGRPAKLRKDTVWRSKGMYLLQPVR